MNQDPNSTQTNGNTAFSSQPNLSQTNPFTGDLKGEFTSDFGTNTNAVSQIFKSSGFGGGDRNKMILIGVAVLALAVGALFYFTSTEDESFNIAGETPVAKPSTPPVESDADAEEEGDAAVEEKATPATQEAAKTEAAPAAEAASGSITIASPADGAGLTYDETQGAAVFKWQGGADRIVFSRSADMKKVVRSANLKGASSYSFQHPYPGTWYWRVENASGASEVRKFMVNAPERRNIQVSAPAQGASLAGSGGVVSWQGDQKVARYQVQLVQAGQSWANPTYRFGTSGNNVTLQGVSPGKYDLRVGAFSEVSGRWEWHLVSGVTVQ